MKWWRGWASGFPGSIWSLSRYAWLAVLLGAALPARGAEPWPAAPAEMAVSLAPESVLEAGDRMARMLAANNEIPADLDLEVDRTVVRATAGQCFLLFCDFLAQAQTAGAYPERTPLARGPVRVMAEEAATPLAAPPDAEGLPAVQTSRLLAQCAPAAEMIRRTQTLPGGIWVQGRRLKPSEFLGAVATILQQLRYFGVAPDLVAVRPYRPPSQWAEAVAAAAAAATPASPIAAADLAPQAEAPPGPEPPSLRLIPSEAQTVKALTPVTVIYHGPKAFLHILIDGKITAVSNVSPFTYVWDTRVAAEGPHAISAEAVSGGETLAQAGIALTVDNGGPAL